jgi:hypothetical protein
MAWRKELLKTSNDVAIFHVIQRPTVLHFVLVLQAFQEAQQCRHACEHCRIYGM